MFDVLHIGLQKCASYDEELDLHRWNARGVRAVLRDRDTGLASLVDDMLNQHHTPDARTGRVARVMSGGEPRGVAS